MSPEDALPLAKQIADGLTALDFGLARATESGVGEPMSQSGPSQILGTPDYMAPEQMLGKVVTPALN